MKKIIYACLFACCTLGFISCGDDDTLVETIDTALPQGAFTSQKAGTFIAQNGTNSKGMVALGSDIKSNTFLKLGSDFTTVLATGTVTVYMSTSDMFKADPMKGNPDLKLVGIIAKNGEQFLKLPNAADSKFNHVILWCGSANIPFGYAKLQ
jgi:hypothetical protein